MARKIFINICTQDVEKSKDFFSKLGFDFNPQFTHENAACLILSDNVFVQMMTEPFFKKFGEKDICNSQSQKEYILAVQLESKEAVDNMVKAAIEGGGKAHKEAKDSGFMYGHGFTDLDGHIWDIFAMPQQ